MRLMAFSNAIDGGADGCRNEHRFHRLIANVRDRVVAGRQRGLAHLERCVAQGIGATLPQQIGVVGDAADCGPRAAYAVHLVGELVQFFVGCLLRRPDRVLGGLLGRID